MRFLDYLIEDPIPAVDVGRNAIVLANVPRPERFALHKLPVSESREHAPEAIDALGALWQRRTRAVCSQSFSQSGAMTSIAEKR